MLRSPAPQPEPTPPSGNSECVAAPPPSEGDVADSDSPIAQKRPFRHLSIEQLTRQIVFEMRRMRRGLGFGTLLVRRS